MLLSVFFGTSMVASRFALGQMAPLTWVMLRMVLGSLCFVGVYAFSRGRSLPRDGRVWRRAPVLGIFGTAVPMSLIVVSLLYQSSGITSMLLTLGPAVTALMAHVALADERLNRRTAAGILLAMSGAAVLVALGETGLPDVREANPLGYVLVMGANVSGAAAIIYARLTMNDLDALDVASVRVWSAMALMLPVGLLAAGLNLSAVTVTGYAVLGYAAFFGTFLAMLLEVSIIQRFGATATAMASNFTPIVVLISGALLLGEQITPGMIGAMVLIVGGVTLLTRGKETAVETTPLGD
jgi:drug/metabolite transporter (DMT)-like permease